MMRSYNDVAERFEVFAIHEPDESLTLSGVIRASQALAARLQEPSTLLPNMLLDTDGGMFHAYDPDGLGDKVLLDAAGTVIATGDNAVALLQSRLDSARHSRDDLGHALGVANSPDACDQAIRGLFALGLDSADRMVSGHLADCDVKVLGHVLSATLRHGGAAGVQMFGGPFGLSSDDRKRKDAALGVAEANPDPRLTPALLSVVRTPKMKAELICRALTAAVQGDARADVVIAEVLQRSREKNTKVRRCAAELLGTIATEAAQARLFEILDDDRAASVRRHAIYGLAKLGGDEAKARLTAVGATEKAKSVREAAAKALADWK